MQVLKNWTEETTKKFQKEILVFEHSLPETDLFSDESLIWLLENHPKELIDVCSMTDPDHPTNPNRFITGDFRDSDAETILAAAKAGRIWVNVREGMNIHPKYKAMLDQMYAEVSKEKGKQIYNPRGGILISSPVSQTPYHCDKSETLLWHVRGVKRVYVYPNNQKYLPETCYEAMLDEMANDDLPYNADYDKEATIIDLQPGQAACWPLNTPHRVDNSEFCVSVATEYSTTESVTKNAVVRVNSFLRRKFGLKPRHYADTGVIGRYLKAGLSHGLTHYWRGR